MSKIPTRCFDVRQSTEDSSRTLTSGHAFCLRVPRSLHTRFQILSPNRCEFNSSVSDTDTYHTCIDPFDFLQHSVPRSATASPTRVRIYLAFFNRSI